MHVTNCHGWGLVLALAAFAGLAQAAEFDASIKAPMMKNAAELRSQAQDFSTRYAALGDAAPEELIRDAALAREQFDLKWQVQHAINLGNSLDELATAGVTPRGDGSYIVDVEKHPEWFDLHETMAGFLSRANLAVSAKALIDRGFRPHDVEILEQFVATNNPDAASANETLPLTLEFGRAVRKYDRIRRPVPDGLVLSYFYQRAKANSESKRLWVAALLKRLDAQRVRVLLSTFTEMKPVVLWAPDNLEEGIATLLTQVRRPDFEDRVQAEARGVAP